MFEVIKNGYNRGQSYQANAWKFINKEWAQVLTNEESKPGETLKAFMDRLSKKDLGMPESMSVEWIVVAKDKPFIIVGIVQIGVARLDLGIELYKINQEYFKYYGLIIRHNLVQNRPLILSCWMKPYALPKTTSIMKKIPINYK